MTMEPHLAHGLAGLGSLEWRDQAGSPSLQRLKCLGWRLYGAAGHHAH